MDLRVFPLQLLPVRKTVLGISQLISKLEAYLPPEQVERVREAYEFALRARTRASSAAPASPTSPTRSRSPTSSPTCTSTPRR